MQAINKKKSNNTIQASPDIDKVIADGQRLITYIARNGNVQLDPEATQIVIEAKYKKDNAQWTVQNEQQFLINYDKLAKIVYPVTVESIHAVIPSSLSKKRDTTRAERAVAWYRRYTMLALLILLVIQMYYIFGNGLSLNLNEFFEQRQSLIEKTGEFTGATINDSRLVNEIKLLNQKIDANYKLLKLWNQVWSFGGRFSDTIPNYTQKKFELEKRMLNRKSKRNEAKLDELELDESLYQARIVYFENLLSAEAILKVMQAYILPLLYGLLGAFIFVLRSLSSEIKSVTYTHDSEIRFRLRLTLGALGGMIIGWFLKPEELQVSASISSMALAFLMGYNVDVLFSLMDNLIDKVKQNIEKQPSDKSNVPPAKSNS